MRSLTFVAVLLAIVVLGAAWPAAVNAKMTYATSRSNQFPRFMAPYSDAPASCVLSYRQLDGDRNGKLDDEVASGKRAPDMKVADQCIADKGGAWGYYLKGRMLATQMKFNEAARHGEAAWAVRAQPGPLPPPEDDVALFRANALMDADRPKEARPIYDQLIAKHPRDMLLHQLRDSPTWPPTTNSVS